MELRELQRVMSLRRVPTLAEMARWCGNLGEMEHV